MCLPCISFVFFCSTSPFFFPHYYQPFLPRCSSSHSNSNSRKEPPPSSLTTWKVLDIAFSHTYPTLIGPERHLSSHKREREEKKKRSLVFTHNHFSFLQHDTETMVNAFAEELKARGNEAFAAKRFEDAIVLYDKAIETDETNFVYFNNRAAAYHELKNYAKAIENAKKSISIENNPKAHARLGAALWAQGKLREAKGEFEVAAAMDPSNKSHRESVQALEQLINPLPTSSGFANRRGVPHPYEYARAAAAANAAVPTHGGEFVSVDCGPFGLLLDVVVLLLTVLFVMASFFSPSLPGKLWAYLLTATMAQQALVMRARNLLQAKMDVLNSWMSNFCSLLFLLCFFALLIGVRPIIFMPVFIAAYSVLDLINKRQQIAAQLGPLYRVIAPYAQMAEDSKEQIRIFAGSVEALLTFTVMLTGGTFFTLVYIQYAKNRYNHDGYVKLAFKGLRMNITRLTTASFMPAVVDKYAQKFFDLLSNVAEQPV